MDVNGPIASSAMGAEVFLQDEAKPEPRGGSAVFLGAGSPTFAISAYGKNLLHKGIERLIARWIDRHFSALCGRSARFVCCGAVSPNRPFVIVAANPAGQCR
jgi:hypothetical protein